MFYCKDKWGVSHGAQYITRLGGAISSHEFICSCRRNPFMRKLVDEGILPEGLPLNKLFFTWQETFYEKIHCRLLQVLTSKFPYREGFSLEDVKYVVFASGRRGMVWTDLVIPHANCGKFSYVAKTWLSFFRWVHSFIFANITCWKKAVKRFYRLSCTMITSEGNLLILISYGNY